MKGIDGSTASLLFITGWRFAGGGTTVKSSLYTAFRVTSSIDASEQFKPVCVVEPQLKHDCTILFVG
jgi:hypothetical protein